MYINHIIQTNFTTTLDITVSTLFIYFYNKWLARGIQILWNPKRIFNISMGQVASFTRVAYTILKGSPYRYGCRNHASKYKINLY